MSSLFPIISVCRNFGSISSTSGVPLIGKLVNRVLKGDFERQKQFLFHFLQSKFCDDDMVKKLSNIEDEIWKHNPNGKNEQNNSNNSKENNALSDGTYILKSLPQDVMNLCRRYIDIKSLTNLKLCNRKYYCWIEEQIIKDHVTSNKDVYVTKSYFDSIILNRSLVEKQTHHFFAKRMVISLENNINPVEWDSTIMHQMIKAKTFGFDFFSAGYGK